MFKTFDELPLELQNKFKSNNRPSVLNRSKNAYVSFINILNFNKDILIGDYINTDTPVCIKRGKCGHISEVIPDTYKRKRGSKCRVCNNRSIQKGINDIATTHPQYVKYFKNIEDTYIYSSGSHAIVPLVCPNCGEERNDIKIETLITYGFSCHNCSNEISYPERLFRSLLKQLDVNFSSQYKIEGFRYKYDFYFNSCIIELHGMQHYDAHRQPSWCPYDEVHERDLLKYDIAVLNGFEYNKNYFIIDCRYSNIKWIKEQITNSKLFDKLGINSHNIDWNSIDIEIKTPIKMKVIEKWNYYRKMNLEDNRVLVIANELGIDRSTVVRYLKWGTENGLCVYDSKEEMVISATKNGKLNKGKPKNKYKKGVDMNE